ncbi:glycosyltransferase [Thermosipho africanus]|uniref:glycosyltransferase n=1 Tax=Thermosipho africanus TaxID=2421 RepID=UPI001E5552E3|nr:glycosyltransferase [Thermosipho africanus]
MKNKKCLLSVAMIMKDEAYNLDRALGSIKPYVDEIIVVDTGSKDNSVEIAKNIQIKCIFINGKTIFQRQETIHLNFQHVNGF